MEWSGTPSSDTVSWEDTEGSGSRSFPKTRPDDFFAELNHIHDVLTGVEPYEKSPIRIETGIEVMHVLDGAMADS